MSDKMTENYFCVFCETTESLKEFKAVYVCEDCIESAKSFKISEPLEEID